jgi:hypothetical protein
MWGVILKMKTGKVNLSKTEYRKVKQKMLAIICKNHFMKIIPGTKDIELYTGKRKSHR